MIVAGRVTVNSAPAALGQSADPERDDIRVDGVPLPTVGARVYIMLHKPRGYVTTLHDERGRRTVAELVSGVGARVYPVGRLDLNSEGLLILTNDGAAANALMHPSHDVAKTYLVDVSGAVSDRAAEVMRGVTELDGDAVRPASVEILDGGRLSITIWEGRNRQVRRLCEKAGLKVRRLVRVAEGELRLGTLPPRAWRYLSREEVAYIKSLF